MKSVLSFIIENWFQVAVLILLLMCWVRLGEVVKNTDEISSISNDTYNTRWTLNGIHGFLDNIEDNTAETANAVQSLY